MAALTVGFLIIANAILFFDSFLGTFLNVYLFYKFGTRNGIISGFYKLCLVKTIPNAIVCTCFLFWAVPLGSLQIQSVPRLANVLVGQLAGSGAYIFGPLLHVCMAANRFLSLYFALEIRQFSKLPVTFLSIIIAAIIALIYTVIGLPKNCGFLYLPEVLSWSPEDGDCAEMENELVLYSIFTCAFLSNSMNMATAGKLLIDKVAGVRALESKARRKKYILYFTQTIIQDCLHVIDIVNSTFTYRLNSDAWFQFMCLTFSFCTIHTLDGCVMFYFHTEVQPSWLWKKTVQKKLVNVVAVSREATIN